MSLIKNVANSVERIKLILEQHVRTTEFARFQFDWYERELKEITPTLWTVLEAAATSLDTDYKRKSVPVSSVPACAVAAAVLLKEQTCTCQLSSTFRLCYSGMQFINHGELIIQNSYLPHIKSI